MTVQNLLFIYFISFYFILWDRMSSVSSQLQDMSRIDDQRFKAILEKIGSRSRPLSDADISRGKIIL